MIRINQLRPELVHYIPEQAEPGILYISERYATAMHLCCCGCGEEVVTPLNAAKWRLKTDGEATSLHPSIGNWSFPCQSHYWIVRNRVVWAKAMSPDMIAEVKARDLRDATTLPNDSTGWFMTLTAKLKTLAARVATWFKG